MSVLKSIQQTVHDRLVADPFFTNIPVITENIGDIENAIQTAIAKLGVCAIVVTPTATTSFPDTLSPYFDNIRIIVRVVEKVLLNRSAHGTNKSASDVAEMVAALLHNYEPTGVSENLFLDNPSITIANSGATGLLSYDVRLKTAAGFELTIDKVATPVIDLAAGTMRLSCATPGAAIWYTTDGSSPTPGNPTAKVWLGAQVSGTYAIPNGASSGTLTGLGLPFLPALVVMTVSSPATGLILVADEAGPITQDGWTFNMNGFTDSDQYVLNWTAFSNASMIVVANGTKIRAQGWLTGKITSKESDRTVTDSEGMLFPPLPAFVDDGEMVPTVDNSGNVTSWPFIDQTTGLVVYVRVSDGAFTISDS